MKSVNRGKKPIAVKVGNVTVKIYRVNLRGYDYFQVADYSSGTRKLLSFTEEEEARNKAAEIAVKLTNGEAAALTLTNTDRATYLRAIDLLKASGTPLEVAALHFSEAVRILGSDLVIEAAKFYAKRHAKNIAPKPLKLVYEELIADAQARKLSSRYIEDLRWRCAKFVNQRVCMVSSVTASDVRMFLQGMKLSPRSHNNYLRALSRLFEFAKERHYLPADHDVMEGIRPVKDVGGEIEVFTPTEIARLLAAAGKEVLPFLVIGAFAGLRSAEIERLSWDEINLPERFIRVTAGKGKTASRRIVPITDNLAKWLEPYAKCAGPVWPHGHAFLHESVRDLVKRTGDENLPPVKWKHNALRHSFISYRLAEIQNAAQVALEAGNSPQMIFQHYRELVRPADAHKWFAVVPDAPANIVQLADKQPKPGATVAMSKE